jgi:hypothetical protein
MGAIEPLDCASGKSGARFYITSDKRYILKTVGGEDIEGLHNILSDYHKVIFMFFFRSRFKIDQFQKLFYFKAHC